ncbi:hypothetical protein FRC07_006273, partial [Ceratobasidium sp. 392]
MKFSSIITSSLLVIAPLVEAAPMKRNSGSYTVPGLGNRKKAITAVGGNDLDLAIAMLETENMQTNYPYGDNKTGDSFNAGIFKQNWYMLHSATNRYKGQSSTELNSNLGLDVSERHEAQNYYGETVWFAGHRNGQSGISNPNTQDIKN